jgi:hypothetical protein
MLSVRENYCPDQVTFSGAEPSHPTTILTTEPVRPCTAAISQLRRPATPASSAANRRKPSQQPGALLYGTRFLRFHRIVDMSEILQEIQIEHANAVPSCKSCGHPVTSWWHLLRTTLKSMAEKAENGCRVCPLLIEGVERVVADNPSFKTEELSLQIIATGAKAMLVRLLGTGGVISFYVKESKSAFLGILSHPRPR